VSGNETLNQHIMSRKNTKPETPEPKATIEGNEVVIRLPILEKPFPSATGKTIVIATSSGNRATKLKHKGREVTYQATVWVPQEAL
jgi:hypothetical protein